jgi:hypothetical protein
MDFVNMTKICIVAGQKTKGPYSWIDGCAFSITSTRGIISSSWTENVTFSIQTTAERRSRSWVDRVTEI